MTAVLQFERPYTVEDLASIPDDGWRYEVVGGELVGSPAPTTKHQRVSLRLSRILGDYLERVGSGEAFAAPIDVFLGQHDIVQPDLVAILHRHADRVTEAGIKGAPDIVIEITSPSSQRMDRIRKSATYATFGVPEYWIVDPETETILVQALVDGRYQAQRRPRRQRPISSSFPIWSSIPAMSLRFLSGRGIQPPDSSLALGIGPA